MRKMILYLKVCLLVQLAGNIYLYAQENARDTGYTRQHYFNAAGTIIPAAGIVYGSLKPVLKGIQQTDDNLMAGIRRNHAGFNTNADDYLQWAPSASVYLMDALNVKTRHSFKEHLILDAGSLLIAGSAGFVMRKISKGIPEYNTQGSKFPSGHTVNAFRGAELLHQELKNTSPVLSYSGYLVATSVAVLRIYNKEHLLTEVLAGAGLGILSAKLTYWVFDKIKYKKRR